MMRLLFLCLLLRAAVSEEYEGSGAIDTDDERDEEIEDENSVDGRKQSPLGTFKDEEDKQDKFTMVVIIVAATVLTLSVATVVTIMVLRRRMLNRQQGIYSVPTEQEQKGGV